MTNIKIAKPFLKWAGGKTQLIKDIERTLPTKITKEKFTFIEPFVGSGAVLFWMLNNFPKLEKAVINDINEDLINTYKTIASNPKELISILEILQNEFHNLEGSEENKKLYYYQKRELYNTRKEEQSGQAALFIFLNRTCFNGLYRVNSKNMYNVPMGGYKKPTICDKENILAVNNVLQKVEDNRYASNKLQATMIPQSTGFKVISVLGDRVWLEDKNGELFSLTQGEKLPNTELKINDINSSTGVVLVTPSK